MTPFIQYSMANKITYSTFNELKELSCILLCLTQFCCSCGKNYVCKSIVECYNLFHFIGRCWHGSIITNQIVHMTSLISPFHWDIYLCFIEGTRWLGHKVEYQRLLFLSDIHTHMSRYFIDDLGSTVRIRLSHQGQWIGGNVTEITIYTDLLYNQVCVTLFKPRHKFTYYSVLSNICKFLWSAVFVLKLLLIFTLLPNLLQYRRYRDCRKSMLSFKRIYQFQGRFLCSIYSNHIALSPKKVA